MTDAELEAQIRARVERNYNDGVSDSYEQVGSDRRTLLRLLDEAREKYADMVAKAGETILAAGRAVVKAMKERDEARVRASRSKYPDTTGS